MSPSRRSSATPLSRATSASSDSRVVTVDAGHDDITPVRRQPKDLLYGIALTRAQKKAVNGIVRRNKRTLETLEARALSAKGEPALHAQLEHEIAGVRDRERAELRAVLSEKQRTRFERNIALIDERLR